MRHGKWDSFNTSISLSTNIFMWNKSYIEMICYVMSDNFVVYFWDIMLICWCYSINVRSINIIESWHLHCDIMLTSAAGVTNICLVCRLLRRMYDCMSQWDMSVKVRYVYHMEVCMLEGDMYVRMRCVCQSEGCLPIRCLYSLIVWWTKEKQTKLLK